jgi:hypothetical protein
MPYDAHVPNPQPYRVYVPIPDQSQAGRAHVPVPQQSQVASESKPADKVSWRTALLLLFTCCALVWTGIGLLIAN